MGAYASHTAGPLRVREPPPRPIATAPQVVLLAGPNGAGKSTAAPELLRDSLHVRTFVNADEIARGLSGFAPERAAIAAGRIMLARIDELAAARSDFAVETTLSGRGIRQLIARLAESGYEVHLVYLWLRSAELAVARVRSRVAAGGHDVPELDIRRRYRRGLVAFVNACRTIVSTWWAYDAGGARPRLIASSSRNRATRVVDERAWSTLLQQAGTLPGSGAISED